MISFAVAESHVFGSCAAFLRVELIWELIFLLSIVRTVLLSCPRKKQRQRPLWRGQAGRGRAEMMVVVVGEVEEG
jgi:hypothetical protein